MADEKEDNSNARSQVKAQGTNRSIAQTSSRPTLGHNELVSASHPNAHASQSPPATTSTMPLKTRTANAESQAMTTSSTSTSNSHGQTATAMDSTGASPYGTRSRNRTGNPRPNYAEDRDLEEYEWNATKKSQNSLGSTVSAHLQLGDHEKSSGVNTRRSSTTASGTAIGKTGTPTTPKEHLPGMSSFSITPEVSAPPPPVSKKRKAPGNGHANSNGTTVGGQAHAPNHSRKHASMPAVAVGFRETNMMSFESSQGYLKHGKLRADDGTILGIDGTLGLLLDHGRCGV